MNTRRAVARNDEAWETQPNHKFRAVLALKPGLWRMRNGHTARIDAQLDIPYRDGTTKKAKTYSIWKGICVECNCPMTWTINGTYAAIGKHRNVIVGAA